MLVRRHSVRVRSALCLFLHPQIVLTLQCATSGQLFTTLTSTQRPNPWVTKARNVPSEALGAFLVYLLTPSRYRCPRLCGSSENLCNTYKWGEEGAPQGLTSRPGGAAGTGLREGRREGRREGGREKEKEGGKGRRREGRRPAPAEGPRGAARLRAGGGGRLRGSLRAAPLSRARGAAGPRGPSPWARRCPARPRLGSE